MYVKLKIGTPLNTPVILKALLFKKILHRTFRKYSLFFRRMLFFRLRLNIVIFLPTLG